MNRLCLALGFLFVACSDNARPTPDAQSRVVGSQLVRTADSSECPAGGIVVALGIDSDGNGELTGSEVQAEQAVCNGQDGASCSVATTAAGATTIQCDGVSSTVLNGEDGADGADGQNCSVENNNNGTVTLTCPDDSEVTVAEGSDLNARLTALESQVVALQSANAALSTLLQHFSVEDDEIFITGANLHIRNGEGSTPTTNALGNLIVGYNEVDNSNGRTGSHNLIVGPSHTYTSHGSAVIGSFNTSSNSYTTALGTSNQATGSGSTVVGGINNVASGGSSTVSAGFGNEAGGSAASVSAGAGNSASGDQSSVCGGTLNTASGRFSSISGGASRSVSGDDDWAAGGLFQDN